MTMLPDIDQQDWDAYEQQNLQDQLGQKINSFGLDRMIGDKIAGLHQLIGGSPTEPPVPEPPPVAVAVAPPAPEPTPAPALPLAEPVPAPVVEPPAPTPVVEPAAPATPPPSAPAPSLEPTPAPVPVPATPTPSGGSDWLGNVLGQVVAAGGNVQTFASNFNDAAADKVGAALGAAASAGADMQAFASNLTTPPAAAPPGGGIGPDGTPSSVSGVPDWLSTLIARNAPELANDPDFIRTVAAGAKAESGWDVNRVQNGFRIGSGAGARGLFQFDVGGMGAGLPEEQLLGQQGAELQASRIVPLYAKAYASAPQGLTGAEKASWVAAQAERPLGYDDPASAARRNYASAFNELSAGPGQTPSDLLARTGAWAQQAANRPQTQVSQFGDPQLSADEAYVACGPAAAVRFAQMYGRNPTLREATNLAATVGWTSATGMAGLGSEKALMDKLGVATKMVGADVQAMASEAQTGNPVTISTPGHYFFADGYDPNTGAFHVGQSGLDLRDGSEWMTPTQMSNRMGPIQGALFADHPSVPSPSSADQATNPIEWLGRQKDAALSKLGFTPPPEAPSVPQARVNANDPTVQALDQAVNQSVAAPSPAQVDDGGQTMAQVAEPKPLEQSPGDRLKNAFSDFIDSVGNSGAAQAIGASLRNPPGVQPGVNAGPSGEPLGPQRFDYSPPGGVGPSGEVPGARGLGNDLIDRAGDLLGTVGELPGLSEADRAARRAALEASPIGQAYGSDIRKQVLPNITEPNHPMNVIPELIDKYSDVTDPTGVRMVDRMTPEDQQRWRDAQLAIGGMASPVEFGEGAAKAVAGAAERLGAQVPQELTAEARAVINAADAGGVPGFISQNLRRIAQENGVEITPEMQPGAVIDALRSKVSQVVGEAAPETPSVSQVPWSAASQRLLEQGPPGSRPITLSPAEEIARLRLEDYPEELRGIIADHAQGIDWARLQRRGVIPDEVSRQMADQYAKDISLSQVIENGRAGQAYNDYQIRAIRNATGAQAATLRDAAMKITGGDDSSAALQRFGVEADRLEQLTRIAEGARAESGRGLRAWQDPVRLVDMEPGQAVAELQKTLGGDRGKLLQAIGEYNKLVDTGAGPIQMAKFWSSAKAPPAGFSDWVKLIRYNSMLSGPRTFEVNTISNALEVPWRLARDVGASTLRGRPGEIGVEMSGAYAGLAQANRAFLDTLFQGITREQAARGELPLSLANRVQNPVGKRIASTLEFLPRGLQAADEWMHAIDQGMSLGRLAAVQASKEGLRGDAWAQRTAQILSSPETAPELLQRAGQMADRMTYHGQLPSEPGLGAGLEGFSKRSGLIGNLILPFLRTSYHITARGIDRSPLGLVGTGIDVARGAYGRDLAEALGGGGPQRQAVAPLGERLGDNLLGSAIFGGLFVQAQQGNISGAGPDQAQDRQLLQSEGWQPYSIRVGDKWVSYANWGPAAIPFAMAAAATETQRYAKPGAQTLDLVVDGTRRTAQIAQEQTYLQAIGTAWKGLTDPAQYGSQFVNDTVTSMIPFGSAINTLAQAMDPNARRVDRFNILDAIQSRLPPGTPIVGGRTDVPVAQDVLGRPAPNLAYGLGALNPLRVSAERNDPLLKEMDRVGYAPPAAPKTLTRGNRTFELTPDEQREIYANAGQLIIERAGEDITTDAYRNLNEDAKAKRLQQIVTSARTQAENQWISSLSDADYEQRRAKAEQRKEVVPVGGR
jgi:hypothetical protein